MYIIGSMSYFKRYPYRYIVALYNTLNRYPYNIYSRPYVIHYVGTHIMYIVGRMSYIL